MQWPWQVGLLGLFGFLFFLIALIYVLKKQFKSRTEKLFCICISTCMGYCGFEIALGSLYPLAGGVSACLGMPIVFISALGGLIFGVKLALEWLGIGK